MGSALPKDMKKGSGDSEFGLQDCQVSGSAKVQGKTEARAQVSGIRCRVYCSKLKAQRLIGEKANRLEGYKA